MSHRRFPHDGSGLDPEIEARLGETTDTETSLQALAVLIDADLTDTERAAAFEHALSAILTDLAPDEFMAFQRIAAEQGESDALRYLEQVTSSVRTRRRH